MSTNKKSSTMKTEQKKELPSIKVRIDRLCDYEGSNIKAFASANIGGAFAIHGIRVVDSEKGLFVSMPQNSYKDSDGTTKYSDIFHAVTADARTALNDKVLEEYQQKLDEAQNQYASESETENESITQTM